MELKNFFALDDQGNKLPGATCYLYHRGVESLATGLQKANGVALLNPFTADHNGLVQLAAPNGLYDLRVISGARDYRLPVQYIDVAEHVALAQAASTMAAIARDAALLANGVFTSMAKALQATVNDEFFSLVSSDPNEAVILYRNNAGAAVVEKRYASAEAVERIKNIALRGSYVLSGNATKTTKVGNSLDWTVSWGRLYLFTGTGKARANIQAVTDLLVPNGQCAYVDLAEVQVNGEYIVHVSAIPLTAVANPPGSYIDDSKIILFTCLNDVLGGAASPALPQIGSVSKATLDPTVTNRTNRSAYQLVGRLTRFALNGTTCVLSASDLRVARGVGNTTLIIAALSAVAVPLGQALYVDLDAPLVDGKLIAQVTTAGYSSAAGGLVAGAFVDDNKLYLFINETAGHSGLLADRKPVVSRVGEVWLKQTAVVTFDPATRTLSWSKSLILPVSGGQSRITVAAGSYTFSDLDNNVAYLDLDVALTTGTTPATAVKGGRYYDTTNADRFLGLPNQVPMFYWNGANDFGSLGGFPAASVPNAPTGALAQDDVVVKVGINTVSVFVKGAKSGSTKYLEQTIGYENRPFDPTGADVFGNSDLWRLKHQYECDLTTTTMAFTRTRAGQAIVNGGEISCAIKQKGAEDFIGGYHGDEIKTYVVLLLDGVEIPFNTVATFVGKKLTLTQHSKLFKWNTQEEVATHSKRETISYADGGMKIDLIQQVKWSQVLELEAAMLTMLPIKRLIADTTGEVITNAAMRAPYASKEDVSTTGFEQVITLGALPDCQLWGPTGISASIQMLKHPGFDDCGFYIASPLYYNKPYYSVAGSKVSTMAGVTHVTTIGETWDVESVIRMTTAN
ncbi:hypothetical protein [Pseudomonas violetae]|uniref:Uncharacterized protein n=1 Tax=Pseudomonas violetae TaxID=2915813 RepID=A0ABT0EVB0_9PSED|nr:hypothetical protein [Pseudomonas violetae]MCK1789660.1 hypothetical protein [Pseudomonas violetae]